MDYSVHLDFNLSILALAIILLLAWGGFRGYKIGAVIMSVSLFALIAATFVASSIAFLVYKFFLTRSAIPEVFGSIILAFTFSGAVWLSNIVHSATLKRVSATQNDSPNKIIGIFLGILKFFIITAVYATILLNLDCRGHFLPSSERKNFLINSERNAITLVIKTIRMDYHMSQPCYPSEYSISDEKKQQPNNSTNNNTNNQQNSKDNKPKNNNSNTSLPVDDVQKP